MKKLLLAILAVFISWQILDYIIHGVILMSSYEETSALWRPMEEMKMPLMWIVSIIFAASFCYIYYAYIGSKSLNTALKYSLVFGIGVGISFGYGSYCVMPISYWMAFTWFIGTIVETVVAGLLLGLIITPGQAAAASE